MFCSPIGHRFNTCIGVTAGKLTPSLRTRPSFFAHLAMVVASPPKSLLFGVLCKILQITASIFTSITTLLARYSLSSPKFSIVLSYRFFFCFEAWGTVFWTYVQGQYRQRPLSDDFFSSTPTLTSKQGFSVVCQQLVKPTLGVVEVWIEQRIAGSSVFRLGRLPKFAVCCCLPNLGWSFQVAVF